MPAGRPSKYTEELADKICARMAEGESLTQICRDDEMPSRRTVLEWKRHNKEFLLRYDKAREDLHDRWAEEVHEIADDSTNDYVERENARDGSTYIALDTEHVQRSRLRIDSRKWLLSKLRPGQYGDKMQHTGPGGDDPVTIKFEQVSLTDFTQPEPGDDS